MAVDAVDPVDGYPKFLDTGAPDLAVDQTAVAKYASERGTRLIGTTAARTAYAYKKKGLRWFDTSLDTEFVHNGTGWTNDYRLDTGWVTITAFASGWSVEAGETFDYRLKNGVVFLRGRLKATAGAGTSALSSPLPALIRPGRDSPVLVGLTNGSGGRVVVNILPTGEIIIYKGATAIDGIAMSGYPAYPAG